MRQRLSPATLYVVSKLTRSGVRGRPVNNAFNPVQHRQRESRQPAPDKGQARGIA